MTQEIVDYYSNLLIIQYHDKPKAKATIETLIREALADDILFDVRDGFNLETAVGAQLDIIGLYVGIDRLYAGQDLTGYFALLNFDESDSVAAVRFGFSTYADYDTYGGKTLQYSDVLGIDQILSDDAFRFLLKLKIVQNNSNHSHLSIDESMFQFFGNDLQPDSGGDMIMNYFVKSGQSAALEAAIQKGVLPKPMGVRLNYLIERDRPYFAFSMDGETQGGMTTGFSIYANYDTKNGQTLTDANLRKVS